MNIRKLMSFLTAWIFISMVIWFALTGIFSFTFWCPWTWWLMADGLPWATPIFRFVFAVFSIIVFVWLLPDRPKIVREIAKDTGPR